MQEMFSVISGMDCKCGRSSFLFSPTKLLMPLQTLQEISNLFNKGHFEQTTARCVLHTLVRIQDNIRLPNNLAHSWNAKTDSVLNDVTMNNQ